MTVVAVIIHQLVSTCILVWLCPWVCLAPGLQDHSSLSSSEDSQGQGSHAWSPCSSCSRN